MNRILIVDDDAPSRELLSDFLEVVGYLTEAVGSAEEGLASARRYLPDLVLMDLGLPGLDGLAATRHLKEDPITSQVPIIATTAHAMKGDAEQSLEAGCDAYIAKPVDLSNLLATVGRLLERTNSDPFAAGAAE